MSTRSRIAVLQENGKVKSVYCHSDGYLTGVGQTLLNNYNSYERANEIMALGDLSVLYKNLAPLPEAPEAYCFDKDKPDIIKTHSFEKPQEDVTIAYHRDRKEKMRRQIHSSLEQFYEKGNFQEYNYLFKDGMWNAMCEYLQEGKWFELTPEAIQKEAEKIAKNLTARAEQLGKLRQEKPENSKDKEIGH